MTSNPAARRHSAGIIFNPVAGRATAPETARRLADLLAARDCSSELFATARAGHARELAAQYADEFSAIVSIGGDGTLNEIINGLADTRLATPLATVPCGTANAVARELGLPASLAKLADLITSSPVRKLDLGLHAGKRFVLCAGAGLDARVVREVSQMRSERGLRMGMYVRPTIEEIFRTSVPLMRVTVDGQLLTENCTFAVIGNLRHYGGPFSFFPHAKSDDGLLEVCAFCGKSGWSYLRLAWGALRGDVTRCPEVLMARGQNIRLEAAQDAEEIPLQIDGDNAGCLPAEFGIQPQAVSFCVPY